MSEPSSLERSARSYRAELLAHDGKVADELTRRYGVVWANLKARLDRLNADLAEAERLGETAKVSWLYGSGRLPMLKAQVEAEMAEYARWGAGRIGASQAEAARLATEHTTGMVAAQLPRGASLVSSWAYLPAEATADLVGFLRDGTPLADLLLRMAPGAAEAVGDALVVGIATGQGPRAVAGLVRKASGASLNRSLLVARTETLRAYRTASVRAYTRSDVVKGWVWSSARNRRTCPVCWAKDGSFHKADEPFSTHPGCRCSPIPVTKTWKELGSPGIQETSFIPTPGREAFAALSPEYQSFILGPKKAALYREGKILLDDLVIPTRSKVWGPGLREASIAEALAKADRRGDRI